MGLQVCNLAALKEPFIKRKDSNWTNLDFFNDPDNHRLNPTFAFRALTHSVLPKKVVGSIPHHCLDVFLRVSDQLDIVLFH